MTSYRFGIRSRELLHGDMGTAHQRCHFPGKLCRKAPRFCRCSCATARILWYQNYHGKEQLGRRPLGWPDSPGEQGQYSDDGTSGSGHGLPLWEAEDHSLADHRSVALCGNYGERIRVVWSTALRRNSFLFCVSSVNPASFHPIDSGTECPVLATGRPVSLGLVRLGD